MKDCVNCGFQTDMPYCPNCGQKMTVKRVSFRTILEEFLSKWIGFDNQFGRTLISLAVKPEVVIRSYLKGNRTRYLGPLAYLVIMTALVIISFDVLGLKVEDFLDENQSSFGMFNQDLPTEELEDQKKSVRKTNEFVARNYRFVSAALIPFWAISMWFFYRKEKLNYVERLVTTAYLSSEGMWLTIASLIIFSLSGYLPSIPIMILSYIYYAYALARAFPQRTTFVSIFKGLSSILVGFILFLIAVGIVFLVLIVIRIIQNPEILDQQG